MQKRITYLDVLKFIGILFIFIGHYGESAGLLYKFVFQFHVHLFFFLSGCAENFNKETNLLLNTYKKFKSILVPFYIFAVISIVFRVLIEGGSLTFVKDSLIDIAYGCIRNEYFAYSLWFLSCLFVVSIIFSLMKLLKKWYLILACSLGLFALFYSGIITLPVTFNIRSAFNYQLFYVVGYLSFNSINLILTSKKPVFSVIRIVSGLFSLGYTALLFFGKNIYSFISTINILSWFFQFFTAMTAIWFFLIVSYLLRNCDFLAELGKSTLYFCGSEYFVKASLSALVSSFLVINITDGMSVVIISFILLVLIHKFIVPIEAKCLSFINEKLDLCYDYLKSKK